MTDAEKFWAALNTVKANTKCFVNGKVLTEENFNNNIQWETGVDSNGMAITTSTCPHSEITWTKVKTEMDKL
tara:strand:+ start:521 stop:736 length:216 start_codon:yes stop_codon:yes gene_type:complete